MNNSDYIPQQDWKFLEWEKFLFACVHTPATERSDTETKVTAAKIRKLNLLFTKS
jgi:hypothetical protein